MEIDRHRLPGTVRPSRYDLELAPDLGAATFTGSVAITGTVLEPVDRVVLNGLDLTVDAAWIDGPAGRVDAAASIDAESERITLDLASPIEPGDAVVHIDFSGELNDKLVGFYRSTYTDDGGVEHTIATTQMEATHARRAFPCWDEPDAKAVFGVTLVVDEHHVAVSNGGEISSETLGDGRRRVRFADTIPMSTYLVAFLVGPLEITDGPTVDGVPLRIVHLPGKAHLTPFALEVGAFALAHLAAYYEISYPGDKLDLAAVPDFAFGAMENLGCVIFRETLLLIDPDTATREELERAVDVIAHELAHMWFGDLVTMRWWNGIWLNEAFATFVEMKTTDAFRPDWNRWRSFGISRAAAFDTDALATTRPVEFTVDSPEEAEAMFDVLTYEKGASVVRMLEQYLGEEPFRAGVERYLRAHEFGNTETVDLWAALETESGQPVREVMDTWIFQGGYPAVEVAIDGDDVVLSQRRFSYGDVEDRSWLVPAVVRVVHDGAQSIEKVLIADEPVRLEGAALAEAVVANDGASGFYRCDLDDALRRRLRDHAVHLDPTERFALVEDTWAFVTAGTSSASEFLELADALHDERDLAVWRAVLGGLEVIIDVLDEPRAVRARASRLISGVRNELGDRADADEPDTTRELRARVVEFAARSLDDPTAIEFARATPVDGPDATLAAAAQRVRGVLAAPGEAPDFFDRYRTATTPQEQLRALQALTGARDVDVHDQLLDFVLRSDEVRTQDQPFVLARMLANAASAAATWSAVTSDWDGLVDRLATSTVPRLLEGVRGIVDAALADQVATFLGEVDLPDRTKIRQHVERMRIGVDRAHRIRADVG